MWVFKLPRPEKIEPFLNRFSEEVEMTSDVFSWKARYTITIGSIDKREYDIDIGDPSETEILDSPYFKGDKENTRLHIVRRKADANIIKFCNLLAIETEAPTRYVLNSIDFLRNGNREFSEREISYSVGSQVGTPISEADFLDLEKKVSTRTDNLLDIYADLYNRHLNSDNIFERYKLLYLIAGGVANKNISLRTIRNMLHHTELDPSRSPDKCREADKLFGNGVRTIILSNPDHQRVVQDHLPELRKIAQSIINGLR
ncbi:MAG: hypothetical protein PHH78_00670 [Methanothrix sp.]|nr:hypothetical protein [Methanothrix sp.]